MPIVMPTIMASLHKQKGKPNWFCAFTTGDGKRRFKSTGTANRKTAEDICRTWAQASLHGDGLTQDKARELITRGIETVMLAAKQTLPSSTVREWCNRWLEAKASEISDGSHERYEAAITTFLSALGAKADERIEALSTDDVLKFRDKCGKTLSATYVNTHLKIVRASLNAAFQAGLITRSPASKVKVIKEKGESKRRDMKLAEIRSVLKTCGDTPWRGLVLLGLYTGQRLGDCARLTWGQVDVSEKIISFVTQKTGKRLEMTMAPPLADYLASLPSVDDPSAPVFPAFAEMAKKRIGTLSNAFAEQVLIPSGLMLPRPKKSVSSGKGRTGKRQVSDVTFHSLRHSFTTMLKATGASNAMAQAIVGHDSSAVSANYTHLGHEDTADAIGRLPDVTK